MHRKRACDNQTLRELFGLYGWKMAPTHCADVGVYKHGSPQQAEAVMQRSNLLPISLLESQVQRMNLLHRSHLLALCERDIGAR